MDNSISTNQQAAIIEQIYASNAMARLLTWSKGTISGCICGILTGAPELPESHHGMCPVARHYAAVEQVRKAVR